MLWPERLIAGDSWRGALDVPVEHADWALECVFVGPEKHTYEGVIAGGSGVFEIAGAVTSGHLAGYYNWSAIVRSGDDRKTLLTGALEVLPDPVGQAPGDMRSHARRTLDAIQAVIESRATKDQSSIQLDGRRLDRTPIDDLLKFQREYTRKVRAEKGGGGFQMIRL